MKSTHTVLKSVRAKVARRLEQGIRLKRIGETGPSPWLAPVELIDEILRPHADALGNDFTGYRNHAQRVALSCESLANFDEVARQQVHIAAAFHDLGIWTHGTFDYLAPSVALACEYLDRTGRVPWQPRVVAMIADHHRLRRPMHALAALSDVFRRADLIDVACVQSITLRKRPLDGLMRAFPSAGFHVLLAKLTLRQFLRTPWNPLPAVRR
ncbi:MAG: hypothetical protein ABSC94_27480 [Polyangiaceae bacterium]|jgi:hypothetical protein